GCEGWLSPAPAPRFFGRVDRARLNWLAAQESIQFLSQNARRGITRLRIFLETFEANRLEVARHARVEQMRSDRLGAHDLQQCFLHRFCYKGRPAHQEMI